MATKIKFGTDGWRAEIAAEYTFENVRRCTQGLADYFTRHGHQNQWVVVGYDRRFQSERFAKAAAEVLTGNNFKVYLTDSATPTPVISFLVTLKKAIGAVNITASHNPPQDNGYKVRDQNGGAIAPDGLNEIEALIPDEIARISSKPYQTGLDNGSIILVDPKQDYIQHLHQLVDIDSIRKSNLKVVYDPMWGNGAGWFSEILSGGNIQIHEIHSERNPIFPEMRRPEPIPPNIDVGLKEVVAQNADVLIINDGDADRLGIGDENGVFINQLQAYALLAYYLLEIRKQRGAIVKTLSTTSMLNKLGKIYNIPVYETGVGFKYVAPKMIETDAMIGGEESGGYAFRGNVPERDGILAGLFMLDYMVKTGKKPSQLLKNLFELVGPHFYDRIDSRFTGNAQEKRQQILSANPTKIGGLRVVGLDTTDGFKFNLEDGGWLLIRLSGTEPILRVYCETTREECVQAILADGLKIAGIG